MAQRGTQRGLVVLSYVHRGNTPSKHYPRGFMTQQQLLQVARDVMTCGADARRKELLTAAISAGRSKEQVAKASTMRLALWVSKGTSAI